jgi:hypothetical protein
MQLTLSIVLPGLKLILLNMDMFFRQTIFSHSFQQCLAPDTQYSTFNNHDQALSHAIFSVNCLELPRLNLLDSVTLVRFFRRTFGADGAIAVCTRRILLSLNVVTIGASLLKAYLNQKPVSTSATTPVVYKRGSWDYMSLRIYSVALKFSPFLVINDCLVDTF